VKVLEAIAAGKAVVASPLALEGIDIRPGEHAVVATDDAAFAHAVLALLDDEERRVSLGQAARGWAEANLGWQVVAAAYDALYASLLSR
jgi:glycosyltransferase involved in cell wall biosynthesis